MKNKKLTYVQSIIPEHTMIFIEGLEMIL